MEIHPFIETQTRLNEFDKMKKEDKENFRKSLSPEQITTMEKAKFSSRKVAMDANERRFFDFFFKQRKEELESIIEKLAENRKEVPPWLNFSDPEKKCMVSVLTGDEWGEMSDYQRKLSTATSSETSRPHRPIPKPKRGTKRKDSPDSAPATGVGPVQVKVEPSGSSESEWRSDVFNTTLTQHENRAGRAKISTRQKRLPPTLLGPNIWIIVTDEANGTSGQPACIVNVNSIKTGVWRMTYKLYKADYTEKKLACEKTVVSTLNSDFQARHREMVFREVWDLSEMRVRHNWSEWAFPVGSEHGSIESEKSPYFSYFFGDKKNELLVEVDDTPSPMPTNVGSSAQATQGSLTVKTSGAPKGAALNGTSRRVLEAQELESALSSTPQPSGHYLWLEALPRLADGMWSARARF